MAHHDAVENNPKKEVLTALVGITLLLAIIAGIAVSAWLRPAGDHHPSTPAGEEAPVAEVATVVNEQSTTVAPAQAANAGQEHVVPETATTADSTQSAPANETPSTTPPASSTDTEATSSETTTQSGTADATDTQTTDGGQ